jgi:hypothetical protein
MGRRRAKFYYESEPGRRSVAKLLSQDEARHDTFKVLLQSRPDPVVADKVADLRDKFRDAFTGWLEIEQAA